MVSEFREARKTIPSGRGVAKRHTRRIRGSGVALATCEFESRLPDQSSRRSAGSGMTRYGWAAPLIVAPIRIVVNLSTRKLTAVLDND